jgi:hypothetical protein
MRVLFLIGLMALCTVINAAASEYQPYADIQSITYSQPISIASMLGEWNPPFKGGDRALTYNKAELGVMGNGWQLGVFKRYDYLLTFSRQTARLYYLTDNHLPLEPGTQFPLRIEAHQQLSRGLRLGFNRRLSASLKIGLAASYLQGQALIDGKLKGNALVTAATDYDFQFDTDYTYSRDVLFERHVRAPQGDGYSLDLKLDWQANERLHGQLGIVDLIAKIYWNNAPYTTATASSATKTYDEDGYVRYQPSISGYESNQDFVQDLPRKIFLSAQYQWSRDRELLAEVQDLSIRRFTSIGMGWRQSADSRLQALYNITARALSLRYLHKQLRLEVGSDHWDVNQARYFVLQIGYNHSL